jgi:hypothetical protein
MKLEIFRPESSLRPESPLRAEGSNPVVMPPAADLATLSRKAKCAVREKGVVGLVKETGRYLYWRFTVAQNKH